MKIGIALREVHAAETALASELLRVGERHAAEHDVHHPSAGLVGRRPEPGVLLLRDLRDVYLAAARASAAWTVLGQGAQAVEDAELLEAVTASHPHTIRTIKWAVEKLKKASPQVLAS